MCGIIERKTGESSFFLLGPIMLRRILSKMAGFFAVSWFAANPSLVLAKDELPALPLTELHIIDKIIGNGSVAKNGAMVSVHYTGWLYDPSKADGKGKKFDSSKDRGQVFQFGLGRGMVIKGWDQGVEGMKEGGSRTLIIPPNLGYGSRGAGGVIPPNATLMFDVDLITVE